MLENIDEIIGIIRRMPMEFNTSEFMLKFIKKFELQYIQLLTDFTDSSVGPIETVNSKIEKFLITNSSSEYGTGKLPIKPTERVITKNVFGDTVFRQNFMYT